MMERMNEGFKRICKVFDYISIIFIAVMVVLVFVNAVMRYVFHISIVASEEIARYLFIWVCFLGAAVAYHRKEHIVITVVTDHLGPRTKRVFYII